jgi:hypothetical protein
MAAIYSNGGITAGIFLASILLKEMRYLVYIRYLCIQQVRSTFEVHFQVVYRHKVRQFSETQLYSVDYTSCVLELMFEMSFHV